MKIAIYHNLPSGGAKRLLFEFTKRLYPYHEIHVYSTSAANHAFADIRPFAAKYNIYPFQPGKLYQSPFGRLNQWVRYQDLRNLIQLEKQIAADILKENFDVIHVQPCFFQNSPSILKHLKEKPTVYYCHEPLRILYEDMPARPYNKKENWIHLLLDKIDPLRFLFFSSLKKNDQRNLKAAKSVLVNSKFTQENFQRIYNINPIVCYPGVDTGLFKPLKIDKHPFIFSVGSLTPLKGFDLIIEALTLVDADIRPELIIASNFSNKPELTYLENLANEKKVNLKLQSEITDQQLVELYNQALITVYTAHREPFGLVPVESMACGTPVISINEGGPMETINHGETGYLVKRNPQDLAQAITTLLNQPGTRENFGKQGKLHIDQNWTWELSTQKFEKILMNV